MSPVGAPDPARPLTVAESETPPPVPAAPEGAVAPAGASRTARVWFVDVLRLIASFQMINGHTLDAVMVLGIRQGEGFDLYIWFRGLVSVTFLAVAGIAFHLSTLVRFEKHKASPAAVRHRFRRGGLIILFGYLLTLPFGALTRDPEMQRLAWIGFQEIGILHCIGAALVMLELITLVARRPSQVVAASAVIATLCFLLAPLADGTIRDGRPHPLLNWISHQGGSPFPLFPWTGYVFAGLVIGALAMPQGGRTPFKRTLIGFSVAIGLTALGVVAVEPVTALVHDPAIHRPGTAPTGTLERLLAVLVMILVLAVVCRPIRQLPKLFRVLSSETLTIYVFHLIVLFYPGFAIGHRLEHSLGLPAALGVSAFMLVFTCSYTYWWHGHKKKRRARA